MGGWKLALARQSTQKTQPSQTPQKAESEKSSGASTSSGASGKESPDAASWTHHREGSFSSTTPPSSDNQRESQTQTISKTKSHRQTQTESATGTSKPRIGSRRSLEPRLTENKVEVEKDSAKPSMESALEKLTQGSLERKSTVDSMPKLQDVDAQHSGENQWRPENFRLPGARSPSLPTPPAEEPTASAGPIGLEAAVEQLTMLEEQLAARPISPPDSRDGNSARTSSELEDDTEDSKDVVTPLVTDWSIKSPTSLSAHTSPSSSGSSTPTYPRRQMLPRPAPPPGHRSHKKDKSVSPLRNEVASPSDSYFEHKPMRRSELRGLERHSVPTGLPSTRVSSPGHNLSRPSTPPKPIAKLFVICCRCKYWHDLPSQMYRGMVKNGGATRCPYCLHGMETSCCSGYDNCFS